MSPHQPIVSPPPDGRGMSVSGTARVASPWMLVPVLLTIALCRVGILSHSVAVLATIGYLVVLSARLHPIASALLVPCLIVSMLRYGGVLDPFLGGLAALVFMSNLIILEIRPRYRLLPAMTLPGFPIVYAFERDLAVIVLLGWCGVCFLWWCGSSHRSY